MTIVDAHLDLAYNVTRGRDVTLPAAQQPVVENEIATVGLPDLRRGGVSLVCGTVFCEPRSMTGTRGYTNADEARTAADGQLDWYDSRIKESLFTPVLTAADLDTTCDAKGSTRLIKLLEGADAIRDDADARHFFDRGVRIVGLAWKKTAHAGGTGEPGGLTQLGRRTVATFDELGIIHDASHLAEQAFFELMDLTGKPVMASHSNCRAIVPTDRQLSDEMIQAIASRGGIIGINFYDKFLLSPGEYKTRQATLDDVVRHMDHIGQLVGTFSVGIGTDADGGLGREQMPKELQTIADLRRLEDALAKAGFDDLAIRGVMGDNWMRFFRDSLPHE